MAKKKKTSIEKVQSEFDELLQRMKDISTDKRQPAWVRGQMSSLQYRMSPLAETLRKAINQNK